MAGLVEPFTGVLPFIHAAEARSFRRAAERLGVTTAAISKAVAKLEDDLGVKLLHRTSRRVSLTREGEVFLERCRDAVASLAAGREMVTASRRTPRGEVSLSLPFIVGRLVTRALARAEARYPELVFRVSLTDRLIRLGDEGVDVAVRIGEVADPNVVVRRLRGSRWVTLAAPSFLARHGVPARPADLDRLACLRFLAPNGRPRAFRFAPGEGAPSEVRVTGPLVIDQGELLLEAAAAGMGVCQVLDFMVGERMQTGALVEVLAEHAAEGPAIQVLCLPGRARLPHVRAAMTLITDALGEPAA
jgi:LysR family transcriptional regulator for bpeEF and oprC